MDFSLRKAKAFLKRENFAAFEDGKLARHQKRRAKSTLPGTQQQYKLYANYETMFSDTRPRNRLTLKSPDRKPATARPGQLKSVEDMKQAMEVQGSYRTLFYRQPSRKHFSCSTVIVHLENGDESPKKVTFESEPGFEVFSKKEKAAMVIKLPAKSVKMDTKATQTDFRESEAQTLPWKHEIIAGERMLAELLSLDWFSLERNFPPGMEEVTLIEKARKKLAWENVVARLKGKENESKRKWLVLRMAAEETAFGEEKIDAINRERLNASMRTMKEARERFEVEVLRRLQRAYWSRRMENDVKIDYWRHQLLRQLRKIKSTRERPSIASEKLNIIALHRDKTSQLYAPTLRDGENPSRGHEKIDIQCRYLKRFHGLTILEKYLTKVLQPRVIGFNYEESSKPKRGQMCLRRYREKVTEQQEEVEERDFVPLTLKIPVTAPAPAPSPECPVPQVARLRSDSEEDLYQASLLLGKIIKGRAIQTQKFLEFYKMVPK